MLAIVHEQLAVDLNCSMAELTSEKPEFIFVEAKENDGRRAFPRGEQYFEMLTLGNSVVVSATAERLAYAKKQLQGKTREGAYSMPFILDYSLNYLVDLHHKNSLTPPPNFTYELLEKDSIKELVNLKKFDNSLHVNEDATIQIQLSLVAKSNNQIVAVASAYNWCPTMWGLGVDVLPDYRQNGLAAYLVNRLSSELLNRGIIPCYETSASNLNSQRVAIKAGFFPAWLCDRKVNFDGLI
jgi:hypothetical protein